MKPALLILILLLCSCTHNDMRKLFVDRPDAYTKMLGEFDYTKNQKENASNKLGLEVKHPIHETKDKKRLYYVGGNVYHNYDMFMNAYHVNGFGQLGMEF